VAVREPFVVRLASAGHIRFGAIRPAHANVFTFVPAEGIQVSGLTRLAHVRKQTMAQAVGSSSSSDT